MDTLHCGDQAGGRQVVERLAQKWTIPIILALSQAPLRFNDLRRAVGANPNVLTRSVRSLELDGLLARRTWTSTLHVEYDLTELGRRYLHYIETLERWGREDAGRSETAVPVSSSRARREVSRAVSAGSTASSWARLDAAPLMHICVAVSDLQRAATAFASLFQFALPPFVTFDTAKDDGAGSCVGCVFALPNFFVEFIQPVAGESTFATFIRRHGDGVHHMGFHVTDDRFDERLRWLQGNGGQCLATSNADPAFAEVEFKEQLGTTIELLAGSSDRGPFWTCAPELAHAIVPGSVGTHPVTHVGLVVSDIDGAVDAYSNIFGVDRPPIRFGRPRFSKGTNAGANAHARIATIGQPNVAIQLIEPVGESPLRDYLDEHGNSVHHIGFNLKNELGPAIARMEALGGRRILGENGDPYGYVDFRPCFGMILGLAGSPGR